MASQLNAQLALRTQLLTVSVATTGSATLSATATGYARAAGSFITDGFVVGEEVTPTGFSQSTVGVITGLTATAMTIFGGRTVQASGAGRTLAVSLPSLRGWDNVVVAPVAPQPYIEEEFVPATQSLKTFPATGGDVENTGLYIVRWYSRQGDGVASLRKPADAVLALFKPGTTLTVSGANALRVSTSTAPWAGAIRSDGKGWAVVAITIPWWWRNTNS